MASASGIIAADLTRLTTTIAKSRNRLQTVAANEVGFDLRRRIFNEGQASDGTGIGEYNYLPYREYRKKRGRQVGYVDLELDGDLRRAITTGVAGKDVVLGITNEDEAAIAAKHEERYKKAIFTPNDSEEEQGEQAFLTELDIVAKSAFNATQGR